MIGKGGRKPSMDERSVARVEKETSHLTRSQSSIHETASESGTASLNAADFIPVHKDIVIGLLPK